VRYWNYHVVRAQPSKLMPSGFAPQELYDFPQHAGGINCLVPVPVAVVDHCRARLKPRTAFLSDAHQHDLDAVYVAIGSPEMVPQRGWQIFWSMYAQLGGQRIQAR
jgi:hypothetical protein